MMVPDAEREVGVQDTGVSTPEIRPITPAASGANIGEAVSGLGQSVERASGQVAQAWEQQARVKSESDAFARSSALANASDKILYDTTVDPATGKPLGIALRTGADAANSDMLGDYQKAMQQKQQEIMKGASPYAVQIAGHYSGFTTRAAMGAIAHLQASEVGRYRDQSADDVIHSVAQNTAATLPDDQTKAIDQVKEGAVLAEATALQKASYHGANGAPLVGPDGKPITGPNGKNTLDSDAWKQDAAYHVISTAVNSTLESNPHMALALASDQDLMSHLSPDQAKNLMQAVHGKMMDVEADTAMSGKGDDGKPLPIKKNPDGSPDLQSAKDYIDTLSNYSPDEQEKIFKLYEGKYNDAARILNDSNAALRKNFMAQVSATDQSGNLKMSLNDANKLAHSMADKNWDGQPGNEHIRENLAFVAALHAPPKGNLDAETYVNLKDGINNGSIRGLDQITQAHNAGLISTSALKSLSSTINSGQSEIMKRTWADLEKNLPDAIPNNIDQQEFKASVHLQAADPNFKGKNDPQAVQDLWKKNLDMVPTGASSIFGMIHQKEEYWKQAKTAQSVATGHTDEIVAAMQRLGGPDKFASNSPQGNALAALIKKGWAPGQITQGAIDETIARAAKK